MLKNLIIKGGGEKGVGLLGVLKALTERGQIDEIENIAGTSVGAIGALLIASGLPFERVEREFRGRNFAEMVNGEGILGRLEGDLEAPYDLAKYGGLHKGDAFTKWFEDIVEEVTGKRDATFADWEAARAKNPKLKNLFIEGYNSNRQINEVFSAQGKYRHTLIAHAIRASMAVPGFFTWQDIYDPADDAQFLCQFGDGGTRNNYAYDVFETDGQINPESFGVWLAGPQELDYITKGIPPKPVANKGVIDYFVSVIDGVTGQQARIIRETPRKDQVIFVNTENIGTLDFNAPEKDIDKVIQNGYDATMKFLDTRLGHKPALTPAFKSQCAVPVAAGVNTQPTPT